MSKIVVVGVAGKAGEQVWSQAQIIREGEGGRWIILTMEKPPESGLLDLNEVGSEILREWANETETIKTKSEAGKVSEKLLAGVNNNIAVEIIGGNWEGERVRFWGRGERRAYLKRGEKLAKLGKDTAGEWWSEGELLSGDRALIVNKRWEQELGSSGIKNILDEEKLTETLPLKAQGAINSEGLAGIALLNAVEEGGDRNINNWWNKWRGNREIKLKQEAQPTKFRSLWVGATVLTVLLAMIVLGVIRKGQITQQRQYAELEQSIRAKMSEAERVVATNPTQVNTLLSDARETIEAYLGSEPKDSYKTKAIMLEAELKQVEVALFKKNEVVLSTIVELSVLEKGLESKRMGSDGKNNLVWMDSKVPRVVAMNIIDRSKQEVTGENLPEGKAIASSESEVFWLAENGVWKSSWKEKKLERVIVPDEFWQDPQLVEVFAGNVYVLDKSQSEIWKYPVLTEGYGSRRRWLAPGVEPDLTKVIQMRVTGDIWLLTETGKIVRYNRGSPTDFTLEGYPYVGEGEILNNPRAMYVSENSAYIAENGANRIVVVSTEGKFEAQYINSEFSNVDDLAVLDNKMYVLMGNVVKEFGL